MGDKKWPLSREGVGYAGAATSISQTIVLVSCTCGGGTSPEG